MLSSVTYTVRLPAANRLHYLLTDYICSIFLKHFRLRQVRSPTILYWPKPTELCYRCKHFVRYEGAMTVIGINIASLMMLLRMYAMYEKRKVVVVLVALVFVLELGTNAWLLTHGIGTCLHSGILSRRGVLRRRQCESQPSTTALASKVRSAGFSLRTMVTTLTVQGLPQACTMIFDSSKVPVSIPLSSLGVQ